MGRQYDVIEANLAAGELDAQTVLRVDSNVYHAGLQRARNVIILPQGGCRRRPVFLSPNAIQDTTSYTDATVRRNNRLLIPFVFSEGDTGLYAIYPKIERTNEAADADVVEFGQLQFGFADVVNEMDPPEGFTIPEGATGVDYTDLVGQLLPILDLSAAYSVLQLADLQWIQSLETIVLTHPDVPVQRIVRDPEDDTWEHSAYPMANIPTFNNVPIVGEASGYPRAAELFQGRMWFTGIRDQPNAIMASVAGNIFDFDNSRPEEPDNGFWRVADSPTVDVFHTIIAEERLLFISDRGVYMITQSFDLPITPTDVSLKKLSVQGARGRPALAENVLYRISTGGTQLLGQPVYVERNNETLPTVLSQASSHLLRDPKKVIYVQGVAGTNASVVLVVNGDGSVVCVTIDPSADVAAWALWTIEDTEIVDLVYADPVGLWAVAVTKPTLTQRQVVYLRAIAPSEAQWTRDRLRGGMEL